MLRRRRTCATRERGLSRMKEHDVSFKSRRTYKLNDIEVSPHPEIDSAAVRMYNRDPMSREGNPPDCHGLVLRPSEIVELQKQLTPTVTKEQLRIGELDVKPAALSDRLDSTVQPSIVIRSMWDSIVSWMKNAVDLVNFKNAGEVEAVDQLSPFSRKRPLAEANHQAPMGKVPKLMHVNAKQSFGGGLRRMKRRESLGGTLSSNGGLPTRSALLGSIDKFQSRHDGLNSILDGSSDSPPHLHNRIIRHPALREYYGRSFSSPNAVVHDTIQPCKSSQIHPDVESAEGAGGSSLPPPPPPLPPPLPPILSKARSQFELGTQATNCSKGVLKEMQCRLRSRMKMKSRDQADNVPESTKRSCATNTDVKVMQWAEIQARGRKLSLEDFLALAEEKKKDIQVTLESLQVEVPSTMDGVVTTVDVLQEASQWFPGGTKELRDAIPLYKTLEKKIEMLNEFTQVSAEMANSSVIQSHPIHHTNLRTHLEHIREEFETKHNHWGTALLTNARDWSKLGLPVCHDLLMEAHCYLCTLVTRFAELALEEASKMTGILLSIKCVRTNQTKEMLKDCMALLLKAFPYFAEEIPCSSPQHLCSHNTLLKLCVDVSQSYIDISLKQFDGFVCRSRRQDVCEHFEGILKFMSVLKLMIQNLPHPGSKGILSTFPDAACLSSAIYSSCVTLIQHTGAQAQVLVLDNAGQESSREIVLWMMFACKYVNQTLEMLGSEEAEVLGVQNLLDDLQHIENLLPD